MALSNILREPRREITETVVGLAVVFGLVYLDFRFALWLQDTTGGWDHVPWPAGMLLGIAGLILFLCFVMQAYWLGENICNSVDRCDLRLRPRQRW